MTPRAAASPRESLTVLAEALRSRAYRTVAAVNLADGFAVLGIRGAIIPLFVRDPLHRPATWTGIGFGVFAVLNAAALLPAVAALLALLTPEEVGGAVSDRGGGVRSRGERPPARGVPGRRERDHETDGHDTDHH